MRFRVLPDPVAPEPPTKFSFQKTYAISAEKQCALVHEFRRIYRRKKEVIVTVAPVPVSLDRPERVSAVRHIFYIATLALISMCAGCSESSQDTNTAHATSESHTKNVTEAPKTDKPATEEVRPLLRFCVPPWQKDKTQKAIQYQYKPMLDWLGDEIGYRFTVITATSYEQAIELLANGDVDVANLSPVPYVMAKDRNPDIRLLVTCLQMSKDGTRSTDSYGGYILALKSNSDVNSIEDLRGKPFGFVKVESSSGFKYPNVLLQNNGVNYKTDFSKSYFLGSHPRVTDAIARGSIQAGATWDFNWGEAKKKHGDVFKVIAKTPRIPNLCVAVHQNVPSDVADKMRKALVSIDGDLLNGLSMSGFVVREDSFYDVVRDVVKNSK